MTWKILFAISNGKNIPLLSTDNIKICGRITKLEATRMQYPCIFFHIGWITAEIWIFNFPRYCSNMPKVRWAMSYAFCSKFHTLSSTPNKFENQLRFDKVMENLKVGTFLRHSVLLRHYQNYLPRLSFADKFCSIARYLLLILTPSSHSCRRASVCVQILTYWNIAQVVTQ